MAAGPDSLYSSYRERLLEHIFIGEVIRQLWVSGEHQVEVLRSEVDGAGYDIVLECRSVVRHIQLKAARSGARRGNVDVNVKLGAKPSGCVVWFYFDPGELTLGPFLWFGGKPGTPLPSLDQFKVGRHTKGDSTGHKAERPNIRLIPKGSFAKVETVPELVQHLFELES
jgi:hypothetical protein